MRENNRAIGSKFEKEAGAYLKKHGYEILEYNYRCRVGEIDIIARDDEYLVFCEVKYRNGSSGGHPLEAVGVKKQRTIARCAGIYLVYHGLCEVACGFDVIGFLYDEICLVILLVEAF